MSTESRLMAQYKRTGKVGTVTPKNETHAQEIVAAIAESKTENAQKRRR